MVSINFKMPEEICLHLASQSKVRRLTLNLSQKTLSEKSGVSLGVIKKFERFGKISLESFVKLSVVLGYLGNFEKLLTLPASPLNSLDDFLKNQHRQRGRK